LHQIPSSRRGRFCRTSGLRILAEMLAASQVVCR
jgi:hypothetical protein